LSRVIRSPFIKEGKHVIDTPSLPPPRSVEAAAKDEPQFDEDAQIRMLAEIAGKERRASQMLKDAALECDVIRQEARNERESILHEAEEDAKALQDEAKEQGYREGYELGRKEGAEKVREEMADMIKEAAAKADHTLLTAKESMNYYVDHAEAEIAEVIMQVVEKVLPQHFIDVPQVILPLVRQALLKVRDQQEITVHVAPNSYDMVLMARDEFRSMLTGGNATLEISSDESLHEGDCLIETPNGAVDARLATQIELLRQAVESVVKAGV